MKFVWHWPFFVFTLQERLERLARVEKEFLFHADMSTTLKTRADAAIQALVAKSKVFEDEIAQARKVAENFNALRTKVVATVDDAVAGVEKVADDVKDVGHDLWPSHSPTDGADNPR